ncbi:MAG: MBOAT family protein [Lachnospiraceae bacterium]|nr:MBOAT family protein [Lachnospiraceae bacterium]
MLFNSLPFLIFFPIVILFYFIIPNRYRYIWLLLCSYFFYACQDSSATVLLMVSTVITWSAGRLVYNADIPGQKKLYVAIGFVLNLSILIYFKYAGFFTGLLTDTGSFSLVLPAGISFYTFQSLTYIVDCYREEVEPENNILKYALFVSFFPCILSGPIERSKHLLPQINDEHSPDLIRIKEGLFTMLWGYFLKMVIVSRLDILTSNVFDPNAGGVSQGSVSCGIPMLIAMFAYSFKIYCDFAGYSFIAIGAARVMGFELIRNFKQPYLATSVSDFWRRWHISLSTWFRDYLYIPLGGSRKGDLRRYLNIMIVFAVSGIWHGATLNFLIWGLLFGIYQVLGYACKPIKAKASALFKLDSHKRAKRVLCIAFTYLLVSVTWTFFRQESFAGAIDDISRTFSGIRLSWLFDGSLAGLGLGTMNLLFVLLAILILILVDIMCEKKGCEVYSLMDRTPAFARWCVYYLLFIMILLSCNLSTQEFLYQKF